MLASSPDNRGRPGGRQTIPESVVYSVVALIQDLCLAVRCERIGIGWVSILRLSRVNQILEVPESWPLPAYLGLSHPTESDATIPLLERLNWERPANTDELLRVI